MNRDTKRLSLSAMLSALGAALLCLGGLIPLSTYACPAAASLTVLAAREACGTRWGWRCWGVTAALAVLLSPDKEAALTFAALLGWYPLVKPRIDALPSRALRLGAKMGLCALCVGSVYGALVFVFRLEAVVRELAETTPAVLAATAALGLATFLAYDLALTRLTALCRARRHN